jgi:hypothetical protein
MARTLPGRSVAAVVALGAVFPTAALAQGSPPPPLPPDAAISQYREAFPTGAGPVAPRPGAERTTPLPAAVRSRLTAQGGPDAGRLEQVATSSNFGAPQGGAPIAHDAVSRTPSGGELPPPSLGRGAEAAAGALGGFPARLVVLLALLLGSAVAVAAGSRRSSRTPV